MTHSCDTCAICDKFENLTSEFIEREKIMRNFAEQHGKVNETVLKYKDRLKEEVKKRELENYKLRAMAKLNIQIAKFGDYDENIDIYSFKTKFEEEHARLPKSKCLYQLKEVFSWASKRDEVSRRYR